MVTTAANAINVSSAGIVAFDGTSVFNNRTFTGTANQISISNGSGASGNPTASLTSTIQVSGISFDAGSNTLSNYAVGTYTPTIIGGSTSGTGTYTIQVGRYTRIGNRVNLFFYANTTAHTGTGQITGASFPFTSNSTTNNLPVLSNLFGGASPSTTTYVTNFVTNNATTCTLTGYNAITGASTNPAIANAMQLIFTGVYEI